MINMKYITVILLILVLSLCACNFPGALTAEEKVLLKEWPIERLNELYLQASDIILQILEPQIVYFDPEPNPNTGIYYLEGLKNLRDNDITEEAEDIYYTPNSNTDLRHDYIGALEYLRDNDMSEKMAEVEAILEIFHSMPNSPITAATKEILNQRSMIINSITPELEALKMLNELGNSYKSKEKEIGELTPDEKWVLRQIPYWYKLIKWATE